MSTRRKFIGGLFAFAPALFLPQLIKPVWKRLVEDRVDIFTTPDGVGYWHVNPNWDRAEFEIVFDVSPFRIFTPRPSPSVWTWESNS